MSSSSSIGGALMLVIGIPASGKSTLCRLIVEYLRERYGRFDIYHIEYDQFIDDNSGNWKRQRTQLQSCIRRLMQLSIDDHHNFDQLIWTKLINHINLSTNSSSIPILLLDDNFYLRSMRRPFERIARAACIPYLQLYVNCSLSTALTRNATRDDNRVAESIIDDMSRRFEIPDRRCIRIDANNYSFEVLIVEIMNVLMEQSIAMVGQQQHRTLLTEAVNVGRLSQIDELLRKSVAELIVTMRPNDAEIGKKLSKSKSLLMSRFRVGELSIDDASMEHCRLLLIQNVGWNNVGDGDLIGIARHRVWRLKQTDVGIDYRVLARFSRANTDDDECQLREYLQLDTVDVDELYRRWSADDIHFKRMIANRSDLRAIRILDQDPIECLFSFICSSNNNIARISQMINRLCQFYGESIVIDDDDGVKREYFDFPSLSSMCNDDVEPRLRTAAFGYRARYIAKAAQQLNDRGGECWLRSLIGTEHVDARRNLMTITGIGPKVADCICLMSLRMHHVVPVDTHVMQLTAAHYLPTLRNVKSATPAIHATIGAFYRQRFGLFAGWAQSVLFSAQLKSLDRETKSTKRKRS